MKMKNMDSPICNVIDQWSIKFSQSTKNGSQIDIYFLLNECDNLHNKICWYNSGIKYS